MGHKRNRQQNHNGQVAATPANAQPAAKPQTPAIPPQQWLLDDYRERTVQLANMARVARRAGDIHTAYAASCAARNVWDWYQYVKTLSIVDFKLWYYQEFIVNAPAQVNTVANAYAHV